MTGPFRLNFKTRSITRAQWKTLWRQQRIINRETMLSLEDQFIFGIGFLQIGPDIPDCIRRIHPSEVRIPYESARP